jgi:hypothetical protein
MDVLEAVACLQQHTGQQDKGLTDDTCFVMCFDVL